MSKYKALIFDLDDTLVDDKENMKYAFNCVLKNLGETYSEEKFNRWYEIDNNFWHDWMKELIEIPEKYRGPVPLKNKECINWVRAQRFIIYSNGSLSLDQAITLNNDYIKFLKNHVVPIEGATETLKTLSEKYLIAIATNGPSTTVNDKINKINCNNFIQDIFTSETIGCCKPKKEFFDTIYNKHARFTKDEFLIIGDSLHADVKFGMNCGIDSCWFNMRSNKLTDDYSPTYIINKLSDLKNILLDR